MDTIETIMNKPCPERIPYLFSMISAKTLEAGKFGLTDKLIEDLKYYIELTHIIIEITPKEYILKHDLDSFVAMAQITSPLNFFHPVIEEFQEHFNKKLKD